MKQLIIQKIKTDMILDDPPYGTTQCKWDSVIPFRPMWEDCDKLIKNNGAICLFGSQPFTSELVHSNIKNFKSNYVWEKEKGSNFLNAKKQPMRFFEDILIFYSKQPTYHPQMKEGEPYYRSNSPNKNRGYVNNFNSLSRKYNGKRYPSNILKFNRETGLHPTQKPVALLEYLIRTYTNENETVLDFTMGSGSTGVACMNTNRKFIGIEKEEKYCKIAKQRIEGIASSTKY
jgi:site-specific DNA-methyltransferase (adenine-specific)